MDQAVVATTLVAMTVDVAVQDVVVAAVVAAVEEVETNGIQYLS